MNKKIFAILFVLICALSISAVSATDDTTNDVAAIADAGSFVDLSTAIDGATGTLELDKNYTNAGSESAITINKDITIDGKNFVIDADKKSSIFNIASGKTVTIKNLIFINGYSTSVNGGAINNAGTLILDNCKFINNTAYTRGGAIHSTGTLNVNGSLFDGNDIYTRNGKASNDYGGAAIFNNEGTLNIDNAVFKNNLKNYKEGVEYFVGTVANINGNATIKNSEFLNNSGRFGSCIYSGYNKAILKVNNTKFTNNTGLYGGAIYAESSTFDITYCNFTSNKVSGEGDMSPNSNNGGALSTTANVKGNIANCIFTANSGHMGGALYLESGNVNVTNCKFNNNRATNYTNKGNPVPGRGGAISIDHANPNKASASITGCDFNDNSGYLGGAIFNSQNSTFENDNFVNNTSPIASAMYNSGGNLKLENVTAGEGQIIFNKKGSINSTVIITVLNNETIDVKYGEKINLTATITADGIPVIEGNLTFKVNGTNVYAIFDGEKYIANYTVDFGNTQTVTAVYKDTEATVKNATLVSKYASEITVDELQNIKTTDNLTVNGTLTITPTYTVEGLNVTVTVSSVNGNNTTLVSNKTATVGADGKFSVNMGTLNKGNYVVVATFDKEGFASSTSNKTFVNVTKIATSISVSDVTVNADQNATIAGTTTGIPDNSTVIVFVGKDNSSVVVKDNKFSLNLTDLKAGVSNITVSYAGDDKYEAATANATLTVNKLPTSITVKPIDKIPVGGNITVEGTTTGIANNTQITITVNDKKYNTTVVDGKYLKNITNVSPEGTAKVVVSYAGDEKYLASNATTEVIVGKATPEVTLNITASDVLNNVTLEGTIDADLAGENVTITVDGKNPVNVTIAADGKFSANLGNFSAGSYTVSVAYKGNANFTDITVADKFNVTKVATNITITDMVIDAKDNFTVSGTVTAIPANSTIKVTVGSAVVYANVTADGKFSANFTGLAGGNYTIAATYDGNTNYAAASANANLTVNKLSTSITIDPIDPVYVGSNSTITGTVTGIEDNSTVTITVGKANRDVIIKNGTFQLNLTDLVAGEFNVTVAYAGDDYYAAANATSQLIVNKYETTTTIVDIESLIQAGENVKINATVTSNGTNVSTGVVSVYINGKLAANKTVVNGTVSFDIEGVTAGNKTVVVKYEGTDYYAASNDTASIELKGMDVVMTVNNITKYYANGTNLVVSLTSNGTALANQTITITLNGKPYTKVTDANGTATLGIYLKPGNYTANVAFESLLYNPAEANVTIDVLPVISGNDTVLYFANGSAYKALFLDGNGNPLANASVQFNINGVTYNRVTDENGTASLGIYLRPNNYTVTAINPANNAMHSNLITVLPTIIVSNFTKYYANETQYVVKVVDGQGNALANQTVSLNINGKIYERVTDENGTATLGIYLAAGNNEPKEYVITAFCNGLFVSSTITVLPVLTGEDLTEPEYDGANYTVKLVDGQGNALANKTIDININGVIYHRTTDSNGNAKLAIYLRAGEYIATALYPELNAICANKITVTAKA